ncbi:hypothetical protein D3C87_2103410 [compost metagenome]
MGRIASIAVGVMPKAAKVRLSLMAASETTLSTPSSSTWSDVSNGGKGRMAKGSASSLARPEGSGSMGRLRPASRCMRTSNCL